MGDFRIKFNSHNCFQSIKNIISELLDTSEPLIHSEYGYASQGLINLMLTGRAVAHVWDHDKDVGGLSRILFIDILIILIFLIFFILFFFSL